MTVSAPLVPGHRLIVIVFSSDVFFRSSTTGSYPPTGPVASVLLSNASYVDAPRPIELITSDVRFSVIIIVIKSVSK